MKIKEIIQPALRDESFHNRELADEILKIKSESINCIYLKKYIRKHTNCHAG